MDAQIGPPSDGSGQVFPDLCGVLLVVPFQTHAVQLQFHASLVCNAVCSPLISGDVQASDGSGRACCGASACLVVASTLSVVSRHS